MCDTLVALPNATAERRLLFAKNSDRERNEAQWVELRPAARADPGSVLRTTYITVPQVERTHAALLCRPFWMWGAEMGVNEHGVAIGNEAVQSVMPSPRRRALTGMDLVRLALERSTSAAMAVDEIAQLLERHGQGGDCGHLSRFYYHNSFIIADPGEAFVMETVDRWWAVERVDDVRALSNALSIGRDYQRLGGGLAEQALAAGWLGDDGRFDVAGRLADAARDSPSRGRTRCARAGALLAERTGELRVGDMQRILRDHGEAGAQPGWSPRRTVGRTICMHAGPNGRRSQTVGSMVSDLGPDRSVHWVTASAAPCLSLFKPVLFETGLPPQGPVPTDRFDSATRWWRGERLHRNALRVLEDVASDIARERDGLEQDFREQVARALDQGDPARLRLVVADCWRAADAAEKGWGRIALAATPPRGADAYAHSWARLNQVAGLPRA